jgi:hypothetical protein
MNAAPRSPLDVRVFLRGDRLFANEELPVVFQIHRPREFTSPVRLRSVACGNRDVVVNTDSFQHDMEVRPGEAYRISLPIRVKHAGSLDLADFRVEYQEAGSLYAEFAAVSSRPLICRPSLNREIGLDIQPLYTHQGRTKVLFSLQHRGATTFAPLSLVVQPEASVQSGKQLYLPTCTPGMTDQVEMTLVPGKAEVVVSAKVGETAIEVRQPFTVPLLQEHAGQETFHFLEPRKLTRDLVSVSRHEGMDKHLVPMRHGAHQLLGGETYEIEITPLRVVNEIQLRGIPQAVVVRSVTKGKPGEAWKFLVDVVASDLFSKPERLFYDIQTAEEQLAGEIHVLIKPPAYRHLNFAAALGAALTLQGLYGLFLLFREPDLSLERFFRSVLSLGNWQVNPGLLLTIPLVWGFLSVTDLLMLRFFRE